jgi:asparagine synthase (glutamine-hydrolysing)
MCGILFTNDKDVSEKQFIEALSLMDHRGPDFSDYKFCEKFKIGHTRLSIIDLDSRSNQPFQIGNYVISFNGEIYNYKELINDHQLVTTTSSDTEVLLLMYIKYKEKCLNYFNGMFAFVISSIDGRELFIARDRLGIKPLYYRKNGDSLTIASEMAPLLSIKKSAFDEFGIRQYRKLRMTINGYTLYEDIKQFPAGSYEIDKKQSKYWTYECSPSGSVDDREVDFLIKDSLRLRKRADVPLGSYLSGGLDSTILSSLLKPDYTWTVGFSQLNEFEWAEIANSTIGSNHVQIEINHQQYLDALSEMVLKRREPLSVPNEVIIYLMTKEVKKQNTVVLSGEGADELFWGYDRIFRWANSIDKIENQDFDNYYCYGNAKDDEVIDYALNLMYGTTPLEKIANYFQIHHIGGLLRRLDNATMLCAVEARVPFLDHRLVELLSRGSFEWKMGSSFKEPLKRIYSNIIPKSIIDRPKIGFPVPLKDIFSIPDDSKGSEYDYWLKKNLELLSLSM